MSNELTSNGYRVETNPSAFARFRDSTALIDNGPQLRSRLAEDGYVFLRQAIDPGLLRGARQLIVEALLQRRVVDLAHNLPGDQVAARPGTDLYCVFEDLSQHPTLQRVARHDTLRQIFSSIFGEEARALDYLWPRAAGPGRFESPHCDWVYMCRGTSRLLTTWMPLMDVPVTLGPLMILEKSHLDNSYLREYLQLDADNLGWFDGLRFKHGKLIRGGKFSPRPDKVRAEFGTRWLSEDFAVGDLLIFDPRGLHTTLDNQTSGFRISMDLRFQPVSARRDSRFVGPNPVGHRTRQRTVFDQCSGLKSLVSVPGFIR